jgi:dihydropteroate synthase
MKFKHKEIDLSATHVMGILNLTPDSFSDGGAFSKSDLALKHVENMLDAGAAFIDVGGESTRPGALDVSEQQELDRVVPIIAAINQRFDTVVSIDSSKAIVMQEAVKAGASFINDVRALREPGALEAASALQVPVCLMHMQGQPRSMQGSPEYQNVVAEVSTFLQERIDGCVEAGISKSQIVIDPGFGFGKNLEHNYQMLEGLSDFHCLGVPLLAGMSRKSMLGQLLGRDVDERLAGSIVVAAIAAQKGAQIIRVHDVKETVDAVKVVSALNAYRKNNNGR